MKPEFDPDIKNDKLRVYVSATGTDDYQAIVAWGEFDPDFEAKLILLAVTQDGQSLAAEGLRLVVPGDIRGGRYVSLIDTVRLDRARQLIGGPSQPPAGQGTLARNGFLPWPLPTP